MRREQPIRFSQPLHAAGIDRLLRIAAARGASTLYLTSQARPSIRVDGEISPIEGEPVLSEPDVEALMLDIIPERNREALRARPAPNGFATCRTSAASAASRSATIAAPAASSG